MQRRQVLNLIGATGILPVRAFAQGAPVQTVGFLASVAAEPFRDQVAAFLRGLAATGFAVGRNVAIEYRWADNRYERLRPLTTELVRHPVAAILAAGGAVTPREAMAVTSTVPIVFTAVSDPVDTGLVASLARPGGNVTGVAILSIELEAKRLELLRELVPAATFGVLLNGDSPVAERQQQMLRAAASKIGCALAVRLVGGSDPIETAVAALVREGAGALLVGSDPTFTGRRVEIVAAAARHRLPAVYQWRLFAEAGGLLSYGPDIGDSYRQAGGLIGRILKGEKPADLPVLQSTKFELVLNLATAKTLGLTVPQSFLLRADEVIE